MGNLRKTHEVSIYINNQLADIYSQDALNLRFNNIFSDPTKIQTISTEYSFSFALPITKNNEKIFDYANVLSKRNKYNKRYLTHVNVDGILIFDGELILTNVSKNGYKCNLYINKLNTVETVFGDSMMTDITDWKIDYKQDVTINEYNQGDIKYPQDCFFPLVSYGMFQKLPLSNGNYTSKFLIDDNAKIYNENFYPSLNLLKTVKKCFEHKGYDVQGDIFDDDTLKRIYMSTNLGDKQEPIYNYGKPEMGKVGLKFNYKTAIKNGNDIELDGEIRADLEQPMFSVGKGEDGVEVFNYESNNVYNIFTSTNKFFQPTFTQKNDIMWRKNRIVIPSTGYYKIRLKYDMRIMQGEYRFPRYMYYRGGPGGRVGVVTRKEVLPDKRWEFNEFFTELQLIKNSEDGLDAKLIAPNALGMNGWKDEARLIPNYAQYSAYPHEAPGRSNLSTPEDKYPGGFVPQWDNGTLAYDPSVNKNFVVGCCATGPYRFNSVIKNGKSWNPECADTNKSIFTSKPYYGIKVEKKTTSGAPDRNRRWTELVPEISNPPYNEFTLPNSTMICDSVFPGDTESFYGTLEAIVHLNRNDYLQLKLLCRRFINKDEVDADEKYEKPRPGHYRGSTDYPTNAAIELRNCELSVEAFSPDDIDVTDKYFDWNNPSRYDTQLNLANFLNKDEKMSDFINNFIKEFNLSYSQQGKTIIINKQKIDFSDCKNAVNLTDRLTDNEVESENIEYPSKMFVEYNINEDERGFYISADRNASGAEMETNRWKDFADRGYDKITLTEDEYAEEQSVKTKTSYNWFEDFKITMDNQNATYPLSIIAKDEWMIEGYKPAEMMKKDGLSLKRRYWFPGDLTNTHLILCDNIDKKVKVKLTKDTSNGVNLSYKAKADKANETLLTRYFNIFYDTDSNYITFKCYLTTDEYVAIKNGSNIIIDDDVYIVIELQGYDASGNNMTQIKAVKK